MLTETLQRSSVFALVVGLSVGACDSITGSPDAPVPPAFQPTAAGRDFPPFNPQAGVGAAPSIVGTAGTAIDFSGTPIFGVAGSSAVSIGPNEPVVEATKAPPPISGGTLLASRDGKLLVASDPDRDQLYFVDAGTQALLHVRKLNANDEPGRIVEDDQGRFHVALRGGKGIATLTREAESTITRRDVCALPRGLAFDAASGSLQVACAEGQWLTLPAAPEGVVTRTVPVARGARDVLVRPEGVFLTEFRSAELLRMDSVGAVAQRITPPSFLRSELNFNKQNPDGSVPEEKVESTPNTVWRAIEVPGKGTALLHQRSRMAEVQISPGGYGGGGSCGSGIVQTSITINAEGPHAVSVDLGEATLAVDMATDSQGTLLAIAVPGSWKVDGRQVQLYSLTGSSPLNADAVADASAGTGGIGASAPDAGTETGTDGAAATGGFASSVPLLPPLPSGSGSSDPAPCVFSETPIVADQGQVTAVAFVSDTVLAFQEREPAAISFVDVRTGSVVKRIDLKQESRHDTGHNIFHMKASSGVACASCHAEAGDDGHLWTFAEIGARRTQNLRGGILGTEPLHWNGDMGDFPTLVTDVFVGRMGGFTPQTGQTSALARWIDRQPQLTAPAHDALAAERGKVLFESSDVACATCHAGARLTDNRSVDVGTGAVLQVPSLHGVSFRTPLMHNGCAKDLSARFDVACGGGDLHGHTSQLDTKQIGDLVSYLETL